MLQPVMRTLLFPVFGRLWRLSPVVTLEEMRSYAASPPSMSFYIGLHTASPGGAHPPDRLAGPS